MPIGFLDPILWYFLWLIRLQKYTLYLKKAIGDRLIVYIPHIYATN